MHIVILAAGMGKRMYSTVPKVLHKLAGKPLLQWVIETSQSLAPTSLHVICGHARQQIQEYFINQKINWIVQSQQLGTGHAIIQALPHIQDADYVLILSGDVPLITTATLRHLIDTSSQQHTGVLLVTTMPDPTGFGRVIRDVNNNILKIIEERDLNNSQKNIQEIYTGICCLPRAHLVSWLQQLTNKNSQNEYYLTDVIKIATNENYIFHTITTNNLSEIHGINNQLQLQQLERIWQQQQAEKLLLSGVYIVDATRIDIRGDLHCGHDITIDINCIFIGTVHLGNGCIIHANCILKNVTLGANSIIFANSILENCKISNNCHIGPFARLRPETNIAAHCKIGNFVEIKKTTIDNNSKINHLSYIGDTTIGKNVNIGAGTITCNFDGINKHQTIIENEVFIGSGTQLVAPITIAENATIGAGSTIRKDAPAHALTLTISKIKTILGWKKSPSGLNKL